MSRRELLWYLPALLSVLVLGALNLPFPFVSDQAVALGGAMHLQQGATLYVDFWDNKMPGLFWFYRLGCSLFGFDEIGIHSFELLWMTAFALALMAGLRSWLDYPFLSALAPLAVIGTYYAGADSSHLTHLEIITGLPIFIAAWLSSRHWPGRRAWALASFGSGVAAGVTVTFKLVFAPLFVAFWLIASIVALRRHRAGLATVMQCIWLPAAAAVVTVLGSVVLVFWRDGALDELLWTAFVYPPLALAESPPATFERLIESAMFFLSYFAVWALFIGYAVLRWWRQAERDTFTGMCLAWLVLAVVFIWIQRFSWWQYHFLMLFAPAGLLGVKGLAELCRLLIGANTMAQARPGLYSALVAVPLVAALAVPAAQKLTIYKHVFVEQHGDLRGFRELVRQEYADIHKSTAFLRRSGALPGRIYVFGTPLYYYLAGRLQALPVGGWPWEYFVASQWDALPAQLAAARPNYIFVEERYRKMMAVRPGDLWQQINRAYVPLFTDTRGTWFVIKSDSWDY